MAVTKADLPTPPTTQPIPFLGCELCGAEYSSDPNDYFHLPDDYIFRCDDCEQNMVLAERITTINVIKE